MNQTDHIAFFRFYAELNDFLPAEKKAIQFHYVFKGHPAIKDAIEALGIPHSEVEVIIINNHSVEFSYLLQNKDSVAVYPTFESLDITPILKLRKQPLAEIKFVLDVHLGKLAKYLRLLGFDTIYKKNLDDQQIIDTAIDEHRIILTRDIGLLKNKRVTHGYWLRSIDPPQQAREIIHRFHLIRQLQPFTLCLICNRKIESVIKAKIQTELPPKTKKFFTEFTRCPDCQRIYWKGSHYEEMIKFINRILSSQNN